MILMGDQGESCRPGQRKGNSGGVVQPSIYQALQPSHARLFTEARGRPSGSIWLKVLQKLRGKWTSLIIQLLVKELDSISLG